MSTIAKPNVWVLGSAPEIDIVPLDTDGEFFVPQYTRLSIKQPDGVIITVSGDDLTLASGYLYYIYEPPTIGWYEYEVAVEDGDRKRAETNGYEVVDRVY